MELSAVCELGKKRKKEIINNGGDVLELFIENPNDNGAYNTVLEITLDKNFNYKCINITEFKKDFIIKYLYKKGATNGADYTPTAKVTTPEKTFNNKILKCFSDTIKGYKKHSEINEIKEIYKSLEKNAKAILKDINDNVENRKGYVLTVVYDGNMLEILMYLKIKLKAKL